MSIEIAQFPCLLEIDYSTIIGDRVLPFVIELDLVNSNLEPEPGENQRFCYNITGVGLDLPLYADLSHLVFGICPNIPEDEILNISVFIDGVEQEIDFGSGGNVELRPTNSPDPPTGCPGLKFDFGLDKVDGMMSICYELATVHPIGPNTVCLFGGGVTANQLSICGPVCSPVQTCVATAYQPSTVCVPVTVTPFVLPGDTTTVCCGPPTVTSGTAPCPGVENGSCTFTITQSICVAVPIEFGANSVVGDPFVQCGTASAEDICTGCGEVNGSIAMDFTTGQVVSPAKIFCASCRPLNTRVY